MNGDDKSSLTRAIVQPPSENFAAGLTTVDLGRPDFALALKQHAAYCEALQTCGLTLTRLAPDPQYPDATFVEDTAILTTRCAIITRPGALSRQGEVARIQEALGPFYAKVHTITPPGTVDGGDICEAGNHYFIRISQRTNEVGAQQLRDVLTAYDHTSSFVDIRDVPNILHLKSGIAYLGENRLVVIESLANEAQLADWELFIVPRGEEYAANCVRVNDTILIADGYPQFAEKLQRLRYQTMALNMSEFQKMDGGLSCLSLRF
jgi:dimethylargininase